MSTTASSPMRGGSAGIRLLCFGGVLLTAALMELGFCWPSLFTFIAIPALPSPLLFLVAVVWPPLIRNHRILRFYLIGCCLASVLSWLFEIWWLYHVT